MPLSTYPPRHLRDHRLWDVLGFEANMELMGRLKGTDIQWVMEWWHISSMVHSWYKDHCMTLVRVHCCSYYSTCRISRKFGECQGAPGDEGAFHTAVFTNRILGKLVKLGHAVGWWKTLFLPNTSTPLQATSNGWRMTWSGFWRMRRLTWRLQRR